MDCTLAVHSNAYFRKTKYEESTSDQNARVSHAGEGTCIEPNQEALPSTVYAPVKNLTFETEDGGFLPPSRKRSKQLEKEVVVPRLSRNANAVHLRLVP